MTPFSKVDLAEASVEWLPERRFREEDCQLFWFHDSLHNNPPITPMGASTYYWPRASQRAAQYLRYPTSQGFDYRLYYGRIYLAPLPIANAEEVRAREKIFQARIRDLIRNWPQKYAAYVQEWVAMLEYLKGIRREVLSLAKLLDVLRDTIRVCLRCWEIHFECKYVATVAYTAFEEVCQKHGISERDMRVFLQGHDTKVYELDRALWHLAVLARDLGLEEAFVASESLEALERQLGCTPRGQVWLAQFQSFLDRYGRRTTALTFDPYYKTWIEDPLPVLFTVKTYIIRGSFNFEEHMKQVVNERDRSIARFLGEMVAADREEFLAALKDAQITYPFHEDHNFYVEQWGYAELRYSVLECGRRLADYGIIREAEDVFFLTIGELLGLLEAILQDEFLGVQEGRLCVRRMVEERKDTWWHLHEVQPPPFIGSVPDTRLEDPVLTKVWGYTDEVIRSGFGSKSDVAARIDGLPGSPGVVEGTARVILGYEGFVEVLPEDVLIAPFTTPAWTPLFSKIKAVVTDSGGMLAHAAICAREYNIPAVVGTITCGRRVTELVRTGQILRVDGNRGVVEILCEVRP